MGFRGIFVLLLLLLQTLRTLSLGELWHIMHLERGYGRWFQRRCVGQFSWKETTESLRVNLSQHGRCIRELRAISSFGLGGVRVMTVSLMGTFTGIGRELLGWPSFSRLGPLCVVLRALPSFLSVLLFRISCPSFLLLFSN